jgi:hypothetical protein
MLNFGDGDLGHRPFIKSRRVKLLSDVSKGPLFVGLRGSAAGPPKCATEARHPALQSRFQTVRPICPLTGGFSFAPLGRLGHVIRALGACPAGLREGNPQIVEAVRLGQHFEL